MTTETTTPPVELLGELAEIEMSGFSGTVGEAIDHALAAVEPVDVGDHGLLLRTPAGYTTQIVDVRAQEDIPRRVQHLQRVVGVDSLARYVSYHQLADTRAYIVDVYGTGHQMLVKDTSVCTVIIDDHHDGNVPDACAHRAVLVLRPTAAARRWGHALDQPLSQEQFLELVVDGVAEIATPAAARLRDLVSDLHAIRSTEVKSVVRTGGQGSIELAENVRLSAGTGDKVEFPEQITIVLAPFAGLPDIITLTVKVRPVVVADKVMFTLQAPAIEDVLAEVVGSVAAEINERTGLNPIWTP